MDVGIAAAATDKRPSTTMRFCKECNNLLYPREDRANRKLLFACRSCDHQEEAQDFCVYRNDVKVSTEIGGVLFPPDLVSDPALPRTRDARCLKCNGQEAVFFQSGLARDQRMNLYFVCVECGHKWKE